MWIYDNIAFGIRLYEKIDKSELDERVKSALERAALWSEVKERSGANLLSPALLQWNAATSPSSRSVRQCSISFHHRTYYRRIQQ
ncbi:hypothetical protein SAMN05444581_11373 [Methylocapsa palsarum]|uniref:Uncharacterized protein n=1 Tax=Methylocapsa palsarum TaxID=1612308 RepID=A0A1I4B800_9HYPH|nr:hypothetical protein SAMN05444581_11373 [Methylocapsa palsarum]